MQKNYKNTLMLQASKSTVVLVGMLLMTAPSFAHTADIISQSGLEEIVVTARKRAESVQDVPVSVVAISATTIERQDLTSLERIAARTPTLTVGRSSVGSGAQITMRGIGSSSTSVGIEQSVAVVADGVYYGQGRIINEGFFDLAGIEILKGPQALFFGKNATAGVISLKTADPTDHLEVKARAGYEFNGKQGQIEAIASGPLTDTVGLRVALRGSNMWGSLYRNEQPTRYLFQGGNFYQATPAADGPGTKEMLGRITLQWKPADRLTATFKVSAGESKVNNPSWNFVIYNCGRGDNKMQLTTEYSCSTSDFVTHQSNMAKEVASVTPYAKQDGSLYGLYRSVAATSNIVYDLEDVSITSVTNYNWNNNRQACACDAQSNTFASFATENTSFDAFSSELRALTSFDGPTNLMVGGYYQKTKRAFAQYSIFSISDNGPTAGSNRYLDSSKVSETKGETVAAFGQVTWKVVPAVEVAAGVRYTHETKDSFFVQPFVSPTFTGIFVQGRTTVANQVFNNWSPEATISWKPSKDILVYGAFKTAYKSGGFSNGNIDSAFSNPATDLVFKPEKSRGFEAGIKTQLADDQVRLNFGIYSYAYKDLQVDYFNSTVIAFQTLTADARTKGVEFEFEYAPRAVSGLSLHGSLNYNRARYTGFPHAPCWSGQRPNEGCNLTVDTTSGVYRPIAGAEVGSAQNLNGTPLSVAPKWVGGVGVSYDTPLNKDLVFGVAVDSRFSSSYLGSSLGVPHSSQSKYALLDASIRIGSSDERWEFSIIAKNLTNKLYIGGSNDNPSTGSGTGTPAGLHADQLGMGSMPRTVMAQISTKF